MTKYIISRCKKITWLVVIIMLTSAISTIMANYIYKFIGFVIDYGINYTGDSYSGELAFLFSGKFGDYGTLNLIITMCIGMVISALISYASILVSWYLQKRGYYHIANNYRKEIFTKTMGKKLPYSKGDKIAILNEDIYEVATIFTSYYPNIISNVLSIAYTIFMLNTISPYLLITPIALTPILIYFSVKYHKETYKEYQKYRAVDAELKESINVSLGTNSTEKYTEFEKINNLHLFQRKRVSLVSNKYTTILNVIKIAIYIISCTVAGVLAINGKVLIGEYLIFTTFVNTIYTQIIALINNFISVRASQPRVEKVKTFMEEINNENQ